MIAKHCRTSAISFAVRCVNFRRAGLHEARVECWKAAVADDAYPVATLAVDVAKMSGVGCALEVEVQQLRDLQER
jgi:hypothetical protein